MLKIHIHDNRATYTVAVEFFCLSVDSLMNKFLKMPLHPSTTFAFTIFSDCCLRFTSQAHSFVLATNKFKSNILKNGLIKSSSHRSRLHDSASANLDKNKTNCIELENGCALKEGIESPSEINANREQVDNAVIRHVLSLSRFDSVNVKKDNGLLDDEELEKLKVLENFAYEHRFDHGSLVVKVMGGEQMEDAVDILTDSFAELTTGLLTYRPLLRFTLREHILDRRAFLPHAFTLVGMYAEREGEWKLGGTVEVSLNSKGADQFSPTPVPPKSSPYLCNMAVNKNIRRRGIGWELLKASEKLVTQMGYGEMYLHCRMIDTAPFDMYTKAGYNVVQTDSMLILLTLQRRKYLMYKKLPVAS